LNRKTFFIRRQNFFYNKSRILYKIEEIIKLFSIVLLIWYFSRFFWRKIGKKMENEQRSWEKFLWKVRSFYFLIWCTEKFLIFLFFLGRCGGLKDFKKSSNPTVEVYSKYTLKILCTKRSKFKISKIRKKGRKSVSLVEQR
jgi:hypothetical protein